MVRKAGLGGHGRGCASCRPFRGAGTRLWPLSRTLYPKQLVPLVSARTMVQETVQRMTGKRFTPPLVVCNAEHRFIIAEQLRELEIAPSAMVLEPIGRNTAPAAAVGALLLAEHDADAVMLLLPSDHVIKDVAGFHAAVETGLAASGHGALVAFAVPPRGPRKPGTATSAAAPRTKASMGAFASPVSSKNRTWKRRGNMCAPAIAPQVPRQRRPAPASRPGLQSRQLHADTGLAEGGGALVIDDATGEAGQDWRQGRPPWSLCHVPIGGSRRSKRLVR